jgi:hypothetical protein
MNHNDSHYARLKELVSAARAVVTYQVGLPHGATRLSRIGHGMPDHVPQLDTIMRYTDAIRELPIGSERLLWERSALRRLDIQLESINQQYRDALFAACFDLIDHYAPLLETPRQTPTSER